MITDYRLDPRIIHETFFRDFIDMIGAIKDSDEVKLLTNRKKSWSSIAKAASNLVLVFPTIVSSNVSIETASIIQKAVERKNVSLLQILFSAVDFTNAENAFDYIKKFHTNLKFSGKMNIDDFIDTVDKLAKMDESTIIDPINYAKAVRAIKEDMKNINYVLKDELNEQSLNRFTIGNDYYGRTSITEVSKKDTANRLNNLMNKYDGMIDDYKKRGQRPDNSNSKKDQINFYNHQLLASDIRKANELVPTMMIINFLVNADGNHPHEQQAVIGVKSKLYPVDSTDMLNRIIIKNQDHNGLLKLVKATTREISFCKDFLFGIDKIKMDALSQSRKGRSSELWKMLERRSLKSKLRRALSNTNDASAITTMVITQEEVDYLKKMENIDISKPAVIRPIMEAYNLLGFCIVDEVLEIAKFIWDTGEDIYEEISFNNLEKENTSNDYKKIINLMTKVSR